MCLILVSAHSGCLMSSSVWKDVILAWPGAWIGSAFQESRLWLIPLWLLQVSLPKKLLVISDSPTPGQMREGRYHHKIYRDFLVLWDVRFISEGFSWREGWQWLSDQFDWFTWACWFLLWGHCCSLNHQWCIGGCGLCGGNLCPDRDCAPTSTWWENSSSPHSEQDGQVLFGTEGWWVNRHIRRSSGWLKMLMSSWQPMKIHCLVMCKSILKREQLPSQLVFMAGPALSPILPRHMHQNSM